MAGLISTGIWGFICSATMKAGKITATFISGATGWIIKNNGDAEFKSIYARDKIVTNEYVYNRIRVTEDEEVISSNGKILAAFLNDDGTYNVQLDLREGDLNPFTADDLLQGYYHSPGNTGVIYAVQKMSVIEVLDDQTMNVTCLSGSSPYKYMVIVRVGNTKDTDRQSFIRISSRTNCQYFYDGITSFVDLDNPDKVKCALGKADVGLIPSWAAKVTGSVRRWFGLVADGVILRGTFILKNDKTIEDELTGRLTELSGKFEIRESGITGKWQEVIDASNSVAESEESVTKMVGDFQVTAEQLAADFSKTVQTATTDATGVINEAKESAVSSFKLTAEGLTNDFSKTVQTATTDATGKITETAETVTSSLNRTAEELTDGFEKSFTDANGEITKQIKTQVTQNAQQWKVEVMGADADGNPNTVLAAINADESGIKIKGDKVEIDGILIAKILMMPIAILEYSRPCYINFSTGFNFDVKRFGMNPEGDKVYLPDAGKYEGIECAIYNGIYATTRSYYGVRINIVNHGTLLNAPFSEGKRPIGFVMPLGAIIRLKAVRALVAENNDSVQWYILNPTEISTYLYD